MICFSVVKLLSHLCRETPIKNNQFSNLTYWYLIHTWKHKVFKGNILNMVLPSLHGGLFEITLIGRRLIKLFILKVMSFKICSVSIVLYLIYTVAVHFTYLFTLYTVIVQSCVSFTMQYILIKTITRHAQANTPRYEVQRTFIKICLISNMY